ncbi:MAG: carboxyl transferase domain-containing protein [Candidatus Eisenbacteria bacterium]
MAKVLLQPIGTQLDSFMAEEDSRANRAAMEELEQALELKREEVRNGWGEEYVERVHKKGKLTTWERLDLLKDPGTEILPIGSFVNYGREFGEGRQKKKCPGAGVVTAFVKVETRYTMVIANDNTVASGAWWPLTPEKIERAQHIARRLRIPVIYLVDCSGLYLPEQSRSFPGPTGAGHIFTQNSLLSATGVPQIAAVFGDCIAGGGYMPIISDRVYMTEQAYMVIAGAALIKGGKSQNITSLTIGGADIHVHISNCADFRGPDDQAVLRMIRRDVSMLPTSGAEYYKYGGDTSEPGYDTNQLKCIFPSDYRMSYDTRQVIARLVDSSLFWEILPGKGEEMITGIAKIGGLYVGIIANNQYLIGHTEYPDQKRPGGILYREGIAKISQFSRTCNDDGIPIVWLQDISGFDIGAEAEKEGLLGYGSNLIYTNSTNTVPMITVLLRKSSGAGYYAMSSIAYDPVIQLSTPITRLAVMEGRTLAIGAFRTKLDDNFEIVRTTDEEYEKIKQGMQRVEDRITQDMDPVKSASIMDTDEVVYMHELRRYLRAVTEMCYQSIGYRRVKNPRIWSVHDLHAMTDF